MQGNGLFQIFLLAAELLRSVFFSGPVLQCVSLALGPNCKSMGKTRAAGFISSAAGGDGGEGILSVM